MTRKSPGLRLLLTAVLTVGPLAFAGAAHAQGDAVPASYVTFDGGDCTAKFVRSASGIVNETERECTGAQNPWVPFDVVLQFRPIEGRPNSACDADGGLVEEFDWSNGDPVLADYLGLGEPFHVCVYLEDPILAAGVLDAADSDGMTIGVPLDGRYRIDVSGTWQNGRWWLVDAEYVQQMDEGGPDGTTLVWMQGWPGLGDGFGDLLVDDVDVNWGAYTDTHAYSIDMAITGSVDLGVSDTYYGDNDGSLDYKLTFLGF